MLSDTESQTPVLTDGDFPRPAKEWQALVINICQATTSLALPHMMHRLERQVHGTKMLAWWVD